MSQHEHFSPDFYTKRRSPRGPFPGLNPTRAYFRLADRPPGAPPLPGPPRAPIYHAWRSRDNRKGRHAVVLPAAHLLDKRLGLPARTDTWRETARGVWKMVVRYPVWDISYDVAISFTLGSVIWCVNGCFSWLPLVAPASEFPGETTWGAGVTGFVGATVFEVGSVLMVLEAVNENRTGCFGWALEQALDPGDAFHMLKRAPGADCRHHHSHRDSLLRPRAVSPGSSGDSTRAGTDKVSSDGGGGGPPTRRRWEWCPTWEELRTHYFKEIGFLASFSQLMGATIFWIAGIAGFTPALERLHGPALNGVFWAPQVIGGCGFIVSSTLIMLEVQERWYKPNLRSLGWHIGIWNLIGAIGFTLCGALGFASDNEGAEYASTLSTFIGSWAFLIGSVIQWYESLSKYSLTVGEDPSTISRSDSESDPQ